MLSSSRLRPATVAGLALLLMAVALVAVGSPAQATVGLRVGISATTGTQLPSGSTFGYEIGVRCERDAQACGGVQAKVSLRDLRHAGALALAGTPEAEQGVDDEGRPVIVVTPAPSVPAEVTLNGHDLRFAVSSPVAGGSTPTFGFSIALPNDTTPPTRWSLDPEARMDGALTGYHAPEGFERRIDSSVQAVTETEVATRRIGDVHRAAGEQVDFEVAVSCRQPEQGSYRPQRLLVQVQVPRGLEVRDVRPRPDSDYGGRLTWKPEGDALPGSCRERPSADALNATLTLKIAHDAAENAELRVSASATPQVIRNGLSESSGASAESSAGVTVLADPATSRGTLQSAAFGQLRTGDSSQGNPEHQSAGTYAGNWAGVLAQQSGAILSDFAPNQATGMGQAGFKAAYLNREGGSGYQVATSMEMPCLGTASRHTPSSSCSAPAFHATTASVWARSGAGTSLDSAYRAQAVLTDGSRVALSRTGGEGTWAHFAVPASAVGKVREITFPQSERLSSDQMYWAVYGYADERVGANSTLVAGTRARAYRGGWSGDLERREATLHALGAPQLGLGTGFTEATLDDTDEPTAVEIDATAAFGSAPRRDLVISDLLPAGVHWAGDAEQVRAAITLRHRGEGRLQTTTDDVRALPVEVVDNHRGGGRQLVRFRVPASELDDVLTAAGAPTGGGRLVRVTAELPVAGSRAGLHRNEVALALPGTAVSNYCAQLPFAWSLADVAAHLLGTERPAAGCLAAADLRIRSDAGDASFSVDALVEGDRDDEPKATPALGVVGVDEARGEATYTLRWRNTGDARLKDVVLYDLLPARGDVLSAGALAGFERHSAFDTAFKRVGALPAGVRVAYAAASDFCAEGVRGTDDCTAFTDHRGAQVRALRFTSDRSYGLGEGFDVTFTVSTPKGARGKVAWNSAAATARKADTGSRVPAVESAKVGVTGEADALAPVLTVRPDRDRVAAGEAVTYRVTVSNPGPGRITTPPVVADLPIGLQFVSATGGGAVQAVQRAVRAAERLPWSPEQPTQPELPVQPGVPGSPQTPGGPGLDPVLPVAGQVAWPQVELAPYATRILQLTAAPDEFSAGSLLTRVRLEGAVVPDPCTDGDGACAEINVPSGSLSVTHAAGGPGAGRFAAGTTSVQVSCVRNGVQVHGFPRTLALGSSETAAGIEVPFGSVCTAGVTEDQGATDVEVTPRSGTRITADEPSGALSVNTTFEVGRLVVSKRVGGVGRGFAPRDFEVRVDCRWRGASLPGFPTTASLTGGGGARVFAPLPVGAHCAAKDVEGHGADRAAAASQVLRENRASNTTRFDLLGVYSLGRLRVVGSDRLDGAAAVQVTCVAPSGETLLTRRVDVRPGRSSHLEQGGRPVYLGAGTACTAQPVGSAGYDIDADEVGAAAVVRLGVPSAVQDLVIRVAPEGAGGTGAGSGDGAGGGSDGGRGEGGTPDPSDGVLVGRPSAPGGGAGALPGGAGSGLGSGLGSVGGGLGGEPLPGSSRFSGAPRLSDLSGLTAPQGPQAKRVTPGDESPVLLPPPAAGDAGPVGALDDSAPAAAADRIDPMSDPALLVALAALVLLIAGGVGRRLLLLRRR